MAFVVTALLVGVAVKQWRAVHGLCRAASPPASNVWLRGLRPRALSDDRAPSHRKWRAGLEMKPMRALELPLLVG